MHVYLQRTYKHACYVHAQCTLQVHVQYMLVLVDSTCMFTQDLRAMYTCTVLVDITRTFTIHASTMVDMHVYLQRTYMHRGHYKYMYNTC